LGRTPYRALSVSASKQRLAQKAKADLSASEQSIAELEAQINTLTAEAQAAFKAIADRWNSAAQDIQEARLTPKRTDILVEIFGLGWLPHWQIEADGRPVEIAAFLA
jgi:cytochrome c556